MIGNMKRVTKTSSSYPVRFFLSIWRCKIVFSVVVGLTVVILVYMPLNVTKELLEKALPKENAAVEIEKFVAGQKNHLLGESYASYEKQNYDIQENEVEFIREVIYPIGDHHKISFENIDNRVFNKRLPYIPKRRLVHFDLKGAPPKLSYLLTLFPLIKKLGATGILLEWEDMFPWTDRLKILSAHNSFNHEEANKIVTAAQKYELEIIPLIQTFGHMEFVLKNENFAHLREVPESPQALCPSSNASFNLLTEMIDQVMKIHPNINFLHIGCDEVLHLGECSRCRLKNRDDLFLSHISQIARYIRSKYKFVVPIVWDDMLRHIPLSTMELYKLNDLVEPMVWVYAEDVYKFVPQMVWENYQKFFPRVWTSSAFKGAFGETIFVPNVKRHLDNNMNWLTLMSMEDFKFQKGFRGMAITGWQRYDHFATLCELLPASVPSLVVNLVAVSHGYANSSLKEKIYKALDCGVTNEEGLYIQNSDLQGSFLNLNHDPFLWNQLSRCMFNGSQFYQLLYRWRRLRKEIMTFLETAKEKKAWLTDYNIRHKYSVHFRIDEVLSDYDYLYHNIVLLVHSVNDSLKDIFDKYTIAEWIEQNLYPFVLELEKLDKASQTLKSINTWSQRPLLPLPDLQRLGIAI